MLAIQKEYSLRATIGGDNGGFGSLSTSREPSGTKNNAVVCESGGFGPLSWILVSQSPRIAYDILSYASRSSTAFVLA